MTQVKIGLETHVQLNTETKLFCSCPNEEVARPNSNVCPICLGHPGSRPQVNEKVIENAVKTAEALDCEVNEDVFFSRKTYFYPDMSKNYQITQYEVPVGENGEIEIEVDERQKKIGITRLHIEEDPAKLEHRGGSISDADYTLVDYNRAGTPLLEIVTDPDFTSPEGAREYLKRLAKTLEYLGLYEAESDFAIKSDANISIDGGERVEVKNITGTADIEKALEYEIKRQKRRKENGDPVEQETRSYNADQEITERLRKKETEEDYGYIFDPDLTRQTLDQDFREEIREKIPELPHEKFERFLEEYPLSEAQVESIVAHPRLAEDFDEVIEEGRDPEKTAYFVTNILLKTLNYNDLKYEESRFEKRHLDFFVQMLEEDGAERLIEEKTREVVEGTEIEDLEELSDELSSSGEDEILEAVQEAIDQNPDAVEDYENGDEGAVNFLVGQVMQLSGGKADPKTAREKIIEELE